MDRGPLSTFHAAANTRLAYLENESPKLKTRPTVLPLVPAAVSYKTTILLIPSYICDSLLPCMIYHPCARPHVELLTIRTAHNHVLHTKVASSHPTNFAPSYPYRLHTSHTVREILGCANTGNILEHPLRVVRRSTLPKQIGDRRERQNDGPGLSWTV